MDFAIYFFNSAQALIKSGSGKPLLSPTALGNMMCLTHAEKSERFCVSHHPIISQHRATDTTGDCMPAICTYA